MALNPKKLQKKRERQKAKDKAKKKNSQRRAGQSLSTRLADASRAPILRSAVTETFFDNSDKTSVLLSRELSTGNIAFSLFLVDQNCLGVKDVSSAIVSRAVYEEILRDLDKQTPLRDVRPEFARKLVEGAVEYARDLGFPPHTSYRTARKLFGDIDALKCEEEIEFGNKGKPLYVSGPYESWERQQQIVSILTDRCGEGGFDYVVIASGDELDPESEFLLDQEFGRDNDDFDAESTGFSRLPYYSRD